MNRGLGKSFGYNRLETEKETISIEELTRLFIDVVRLLLKCYIDKKNKIEISKNGNMLLDIAPMSNGKLAAVQEKRLAEFGQWLSSTTGLFGSRPFCFENTSFSDGVYFEKYSNYRFTMSPDESILNIFILDPTKISDSKVII